MNKRFIGYLSVLIGLVGLFSNTKFGGDIIPIVKEVNKQSVIIGSVVFLIVGILFLLKKKQIQKLAEELPIYEGKKVVGYRRN
jgi:hypothetical protein